MKNLLIYMVFLTMIFSATSCSDNQINNEENIVPTKDEKTVTTGIIDKNDAMDIASQFAQAQGILPPGTRGEENLNVAFTDLDLPQTRTANDATPSYYIINIGNSGYIIVSASDATLPILGYSTESNFQTNDIPINLSEILTKYKEEISYVIKNKIRPDAATIAKRKEMLNPPKTRAGSSIQPLLGNINWSQRPYYNTYCPENTPVGCVATATAQIMRYWEYPEYGVGTHSYKSNYGVLSFDYNYKLNLKDMPKQKLNNKNNDIAKFCYGVAVGLDMEFAPSGSGAWQEKVAGLLMKHFKYPATIKNKYRKDYEADVWENIIRNELDAGRPVQYVGYGNAGGHSFVCDGYNENGYFHFNWGWGGTANGYFLLQALNPSILRANSGFNYGQSIVIGIQAPKIEKEKKKEDPKDTTTDGEEYYTETTIDYPKASAKYAITTFIKNVKINNINNTTTSNTGGYNYFSKKTIDLERGKEYTLSLTPGSTQGHYTEYWRAWIDLNYNGIFEENEKVAEGITRDFSPLQTSININTKISSGVSRLRVAMKWGSYPNPKENFRHGEVEDYNVNIK